MPSRSRAASRLPLLPCTGCSPRRISRVVRSGPAQRTPPVAPLGGQGGYQIAASGGANQPQGAIQVANTAAVSAAHQGEAPMWLGPQRQGERLQGAVARHG